MWVTYLPGAFYFYLLAVKSRALCFFSAANPGIENGGMFFQSKKETYKLIPPELVPQTYFINAIEDLGQIRTLLDTGELSFPLIAKPDKGERGWLVKIVHNFEDIEDYSIKLNRSFVLQAFIDYPIEVGIFYSRHPREESGIISSITGKKLLSVTGDGLSTIKTLIHNDDRAYLQREIIIHQKLVNLNLVLDKGESKTLIKIGNHARGTTFLNWNHLKSVALTTQMDKICKKIPGFFYGRFDILCRSIEDLSEGKNFYILELNGAGAEPAHIYQPGFSFLKAQKDIFWHIRRMHDIAIANHHSGATFMNFNEFLKQKRAEKAYKKGISNTSI